jgi:hypothetical protein
MFVGRTVSDKIWFSYASHNVHWSAGQIGVAHAYIKAFGSKTAC